MCVSHTWPRGGGVVMVAARRRRLQGAAHASVRVALGDWSQHIDVPAARPRARFGWHAPVPSYRLSSTLRCRRAPPVPGARAGKGLAVWLRGLTEPPLVLDTSRIGVSSFATNRSVDP